MLGAPEEQVNEARATAEYEQAYDEVRAQLAKLPKGQAQKACSDFADGK
jgi:hypothetical protein